MQHAMARCVADPATHRSGAPDCGPGCRACPLPPGDEWVVHCTVHPHWDYYQPGMESMRQPMSPVYSLKLKKGEAVARVSRQSHGSVRTGPVHVCGSAAGRGTSAGGACQLATSRVAP